MKTLGIIGGLGPESTLDYYQRIIALYRERTGDRHYPEFVIVSVDLRRGLDFMDANDLSGMANYLLESIDKLARAGADFGIISANTPHIVFDEVAPKSPIPLITIVDRMKATNDIDGVILAGTELPLILRDPIHNGIPFLDTTKIHVEAAVAHMLS